LAPTIGELKMPAIIEKHRHLIDFALSSLIRRKGKTFSLIIVFAWVVFLLASVMFFSRAIQQEASSVLQGSPEMIVQRLVAGRQSLIPVSYAKDIAEIRGVQHVTARLWGYYYDPLSGANVTLMVNDDLKERVGEVLVGDAVSFRTAVSGQKQRARKNDILPFKTAAGDVLMLKVAGIFSAESQLVASDLILLSEQDFRSIFPIEPGMATDLVLQVRNAKELATIASKILQMHPDTRPILKDEILRTYDAIFGWRSGIVFVLLTGAVFAFIILAWDKATGLGADERREIGILKAIGWETADVLLLKSWEGVIVSLTAFLLGLALAYVHIFMTSSAFFEPVLKGWAVLYPEFRLMPFIDAYQIAVLFFWTVVPYTIASIVPSWRSATVDPDTVMRGT